MSLYGARRYGEALGRVLVLEGRLMQPARLARLVDARDVTDKLKVLSETEYGPWVTEATDRASVRQVIDDRVLAALDVLEESHAEPIARFFRLTRDYANIKVVLLRGGSDPQFPFIAGGTVSVETWEEAEPPEWLAEELAAAEAVLAQEGEPAAMALVDRMALAKRIDEAKALRDPLAVQIARLDVDWANARALLRGVDKRSLIDGGHVPGTELAAAFKAGGVEALARRAMGDIDPSGLVEVWQASTAADRLELAAVRSVFAAARMGRLSGTTNRPIIGWMASVEAEARLVGVIVVGGMDGAPADEVKERVSTAHG